ncbi:hypothetical protein [Streptomyces sp. NPDC000851]
MTAAREGRITHVRVTHEDRLARFGTRWLTGLLEADGVRVEVLHPKAATPGGTEELLADFGSLIASFSGRMYGIRSRQARQRPATPQGTGRPGIGLGVSDLPLPGLRLFHRPGQCGLAAHRRPRPDPSDPHPHRPRQRRAHGASGDRSPGPPGPIPQGGPHQERPHHQTPGAREAASGPRPTPVHTGWKAPGGAAPTHPTHRSRRRTRQQGPTTIGTPARHQPDGTRLGAGFHHHAHTTPIRRRPWPSHPPERSRTPGITQETQAD